MHTIESFIRLYLVNAAPKPRSAGIDTALNEILHTLVSEFDLRNRAQIGARLSEWADANDVILPPAELLEAQIFRVLNQHPTAYGFPRIDSPLPKTFPHICDAREIEVLALKNLRLLNSARRNWRFLNLSSGEASRSAAVLGVPESAVQLGLSRGTVRKTVFEGLECIAVGDEWYAEIFRLDGEWFVDASGIPCRSKRLPGSCAGFVGQQGLQPEQRVLLVSGPLDFIAGHNVLTFTKRDDLHILASTGLGENPINDPSLRANLFRSHVRVVVTETPESCVAVGQWLESLGHMQMTLDVIFLPDGCATLVQALLNHDEDDDYWHELLNAPPASLNY